jgi:hypothetical protein
MPTHRIRLGSPWIVTSAEGRTRHARKFGWPRTADPGERVWVVCAAVPGPAAVSVNGEALGSVDSGPFAADITHLLKPRNELAFDVASAEPLGDVALEIRPHHSGGPGCGGT